jgi:hypothetical protein
MPWLRSSPGPSGRTKVSCLARCGIYRRPCISIRRVLPGVWTSSRLHWRPRGRKRGRSSPVQAIRLDPGVLSDVARLLTAQAVEPDLLWHAVPRDTATLVDLARLLEDQGRVSTAATALEDAIAIASTSSEKASVHLARARFLLRRGRAQPEPSRERSLLRKTRTPSPCSRRRTSDGAGGSAAAGSAPAMRRRGREAQGVSDRLRRCWLARTRRRAGTPTSGCAVRPGDAGLIELAALDSPGSDAILAQNSVQARRMTGLQWTVMGNRGSARSSHHGGRQAVRLSKQA